MIGRQVVVRAQDFLYLPLAFAVVAEPFAAGGADIAATANCSGKGAKPSAHYSIRRQQTKAARSG